MEQLKGLGTLFYVVNPYETMFKKVYDLPSPDWTAKVILIELVTVFSEKCNVQWHIISDPSN